MNLGTTRFKEVYDQGHHNKLQEQGVQKVLNRNRNFSKFNENSIYNQDQRRQIEYFNENDSENTDTSKTSLNPNFMPQILPDDEIAKAINSLDSNQRKVFNVVFT